MTRDTIELAGALVLDRLHQFLVHVVNLYSTACSHVTGDCPTCSQKLKTSVTTQGNISIRVHDLRYARLWTRDHKLRVMTGRFFYPSAQAQREHAAKKLGCAQAYREHAAQKLGRAVWPTWSDRNFATGSAEWQRLGFLFHSMINQKKASLFWSACLCQTDDPRNQSR